MMHFPRPFPSHGTIGIVSPAGVSSAEQIQRSVSVLTERGYRVVVGEHAADTGDLPYLAGTDEARVADLNRFFADPEIDLILCARGGYGCARILDRLDYEVLARSPKPIVGYSDITALSLALAARAGVVSFSGIMATAGDGFAQTSLDSWSEASFFHAVGDHGFPRVFAAPPDVPWTVHRANTDTVTGRVYPVCLSLLVSLVGTPYLPDLAGAILIIEDVHEELYAVDRMLTQLRLAGLLDDLAAVLIGSFNGVSEEETARLAVDMPRLVQSMTSSAVTVASGIAYGHIPRRLTLPVGATGTIDLWAHTFRFDNAS